jgi:hypothetical protein
VSLNIENQRRLHYGALNAIFARFIRKEKTEHHLWDVKLAQWWPQGCHLAGEPVYEPAGPPGTASSNDFKV